MNRHENKSKSNQRLFLKCLLTPDTLLGGLQVLFYLVLKSYQISILPLTGEKCIGSSHPVSSEAELPGPRVVACSCALARLGIW